VWETRALTATEQAQAAEAHLERLNQDIRELNATKEGAIRDAENAQQQSAAALADLEAAQSERAAILAELERLRCVEEQSSGMAAELMQRCSQLRQELAQSERRIRDQEKEFEDRLQCVGDGASDMVLGRLESILNHLRCVSEGQAGDLVDSAIFELGTVREVLISLMAELQNRTTPRSTPTSVRSFTVPSPEGTSRNDCSEPSFTFSVGLS